MLNEIHFSHEGIGYVPILAGKVVHGFSWGKASGNMSFSWENDQLAVAERVTSFLTKLEMEPIEGTVNMIAEHGVNIVDISEETLENADISSYGAFIKCDAFFTKMEDLPIVIKPADCTVSIIYAETEADERVLGMVHAGRLGLDLRLPQKAIEHLMHHYHVKPHSILVGVIPTITKRRYFLRRFDELLRPEDWRGFVEEKDGFFYLDFPGYLIHQYVSSGIKPNQIQAYDVDTYEAALRGETFSHRFWREMDQKIPNGRMIVASKL